MSWTNNLKIYAEEATGSKLLDNTTYTSNTQRTEGASANEPISSRLMNTCLKNLTTVMIALVNAIGMDSQEEYTIDTDIDVVTLCQYLYEGLASINVSSAAQLRGTWHFILEDNGSNHSQTSNVVFDPTTANITFKLPNTVAFNTVYASTFYGDVSGNCSGTAGDLVGWQSADTRVGISSSGFVPTTSQAFKVDKTYDIRLELNKSVSDSRCIQFPLVTVRRFNLNAKTIVSAIDEEREYMLKITVADFEDTSTTDVELWSKSAGVGWIKITSSNAESRLGTANAILVYRRIRG